ncbi:hypothetical protein NIES2119_02045 [[Phormidium ambiguum] IAM M-71]|uniref:Glycosyltransferase RgtA/B/C/D-like domain-containing protein n=1 Tax=[Phormidium ambiguum] IAM M-71 TaxID=454136 RepID=A0A1U7ISD7_9CYAN|nr:hypothetical protein [Phormidium ambiguum]OKH40427.1 hypothetical protein NIES2119_02045 [Phormidium ambiguum IAM M-71]
MSTINISALKKISPTIIIPIVAFWTLFFLLGYPLPNIDDLFFTGAAINLSKGGEFTNPYLEAWNSVLISGKFYFQPPFYSYTLAAWLKIAGISTVSLRLFQFICYNIFSLFTTLLLRFYGFPRLTAFCITFIFALWHCNIYGTGFRHDALGMAFLALGLWLLTHDNWWRYFLGFSLLGSAVFTSPITLAYGFSFGLAILVINIINLGGINNIDSRYIKQRTLSFFASLVIVFTLFLICINFELKIFISDFLLSSSWRKAVSMKGLILFYEIMTQGYGFILYIPSYLIFLALIVIIFIKRNLIFTHHKILFVGLTFGMILNIWLYAFAFYFNFFFCWVGIICIIAMMKKAKLKTYAIISILIIYFSSQSLNIISWLDQKYVPEAKYQEIREFVNNQPNRKYAIDSVAARFVFDYKLPNNSIDWTFMEVPGTPKITAKDKPQDVTWIVATPQLKNAFPEMIEGDYPRVKILGRTFKSLPKIPFDVTLVP